MKDEKAVLKPCPFCDAGIPNVFQVPSEFDKGKKMWVVECKNMACIFSRSAGYESLEELIRCWNKRNK